MPAALERCVAHVMGQGHDQSSAWAICRAATGMAEDGSQDSETPEMSERDMLINAASEITKRQFANIPRLRKWMPICEAVGKYVNGEQEGSLTVKRFQKLVENYKKYPRQIPVYQLVGEPNPEHPEDLDARLPDGWIEGLKVEGDVLMADVVLNGNAASVVLSDQVRGASIGTIAGTDYEGKPIGEVLEHVVLTNHPFVKGMNIAATSRTGGGKVAFIFTALSAESAMPKEEKKETPPEGQPPEEVAQLKERLTSTEEMLKDARDHIKDLEASKANLLEEVDALRKAPEHKLALDRIKQLERHNLAERIRRKVKKGEQTGQFDRAFLVTKDYESESDEKVLAWFKVHPKFKDSESNLDFALSVMPAKTLRREFVQGNPIDGEARELTSEEQEECKRLGVDPKVALMGRDPNVSFGQFKSENRKEA